MIPESDWLDLFDAYDSGGSSCPECGEPMQTDEDGDGVMTMSYEFCENCGTKDYGDAVNLTNELLGRTNGEQPKGGAL